MSARSLRPLKRIAALGLALGAAACAVGPNYQAPKLAPRAAYGFDPSAAATDTASPTFVSGMDVPATWWRIFHCEALDGLIARALKNSPTVSAAEAALKSAREQVKAQRGAYFPTVQASLQPSRQHFAGTLSSPLENGSELFDLTTTQLSIAYTPDLFGANARAVENLVAQADQQRFTLEAARLTLAANVVQAAVQDALLRAEIEAAKTIVAGQQQVMTSIRRQFALGQVSKADVASQEAALAGAEAALPPLEKAFKINRDLLSALVGQTPGEPLDVQFQLKDFALTDPLPLSLPADLVRHRPDVRIAEAQLHAASAEIGVAAAARWPSIDIEANAGSAALGLTPAFSSASNFWSLAGTLTQPIFEGGALLHRERSAKAAYKQAAAQYQSTVIGAFQNTADALHTLATDADADTLAARGASAAATSLDIARKEFALGDLNHIALLNAEQTYAQAEITALQARAARFIDVAALFQALGGGWWNAEPVRGGERKAAGS